MPRRLIVMHPPPQPTPLPGQIVPATRQRIMVGSRGATEPVIVEKKAAKEAVDAMKKAANAIPGVQAFVIGDAVKVRITGNSFAEIAQKIAQLPPELVIAPAKTICDGEPVQIT